MESIQAICIDNIVNKGVPGLLSNQLPPLLYQLVVNKIKDKYMPIWKHNINCVHLDLLIKKKAIILNIDTNYGELDFEYIFNLASDTPIVGARLFGGLYQIFDNSEKRLYDTTIEYLKNKNRYEELQERLELNKDKKKPINVILR